MDEFLKDEKWGPQRYSQWEQECINQIENNTPDYEAQINYEKTLSSQKLWVSFQNAACCVAQLYKDRHHEVSVWIPFQNAASSITSLYKESSENQKKLLELGLQSGYNRRNKEILAWAKKRKHIRRDDLIAFLCGNHNHHHHYHRDVYASPRQRVTLPDPSGFAPNSQTRAQSHHNVNFLTLSNSSSECFDPTMSSNNDNSNSNNDDDDIHLETFREALALSVNIPVHSQTRKNQLVRSSASTPSLVELNDFISEEFSRHVESRKRSASSTDVIMDSPTHKRSKLS